MLKVASAPGAWIETVICRIGSLEITAFAEYSATYITCRIGSWEKNFFSCKF